jgi:hypothetical protein
MEEQGNTTSYLYLGGWSGVLYLLSMVTVNSSLEDFDFSHFTAPF